MFGRREGIFRENDIDVLKYSCNIEYLFQRLQNISTDLTHDKFLDILCDFSVDYAVMEKLTNQILFDNKWIKEGILKWVKLVKVLLKD